MKKKALITGVTGQDGAYLSEFLLEKGYEVHGIKRRSSLFNTDRIDHLYQDSHEVNRKFILHHGDLTDSTSLIRIIQDVRPDEIYNLAAQSHVAVSFEEPEYTANADAIGALRVLEAIKFHGLEKKTKFYQAFRCKEGNSAADPLDHIIELIGEEPFLMRIEDKSYSVVMRTPGDEVVHAAGFCLGEGIIDTLDDIKRIGYDPEMDANVVDVWLTPGRQKKI